ncbi:MAG: hypothetical protein NTU48_05640 [Legionellales bacterium]|nr:hypothetical protein [Legionellales bacterium]
MDLHQVINHMCAWSASFQHNKLPQLLFFGMSLIALFVFWGIYFGFTFVLSTHQSVVKQIRPPWAIGYFIFSIVINVGLVTIPKYIFLDTFVWLFSLLALPFFLYRVKIKHGITWLETKLNLGLTEMWMIGVIVSILFLWVFYPLIFKPMNIHDEFMDIPEQTILDNGKIIDNIQYINQRSIGGIHHYDPRQDQGVLSASDMEKISIPKRPLLVPFLSAESHHLFLYDDGSQSLSLKGNMRKEDYTALLEIYQEDQPSKDKIKILFTQTNNKNAIDKKRLYTAEEQAFIAKNSMEIEEKTKAGWFFFHHSWVLNPVLALSQGADISKQVLIYGSGSAVFLKHILTAMGGVSFDNYFKVIYVFYPLYFFIFLTVVYQLFRRADFVCMGAVLLSTSILMLGYQLILLAPGYNPMRHIFDMVMIFFFFRYLQKNSLLYLCMTLVTGFIAVLWSKDFGLFLVLACLGTTFIRNLVVQRAAWAQWLIALLGLGITGVLYFLPWHGVNYNLWYMLLGYAFPSTSTLRISIVIFGISLVYLLHIQFKKTDSPYYWLAWCLFFYAQLQLIYYIWYPSFQHFLVCAPTLILLCMTWIYLFCAVKKERITGIRIGLVSMVLLLYIPSLTLFYKDMARYNKVFATHVVHNWTFQYGVFQTTMAPQLFIESVNLIDQYASGPSMYLISKYDAILPILAHRSHALPVVNLALDLLSHRDIDRCIQAIKVNQPTYLFVDSDIIRDLRGDVLLPSSYLGERTYQESYGRVQVMKNMRQLYYGIQNDYVPLQRGSLITVYKRKYDAN